MASTSQKPSSHRPCVKAVLVQPRPDLQRFKSSSYPSKTDEKKLEPKLGIVSTPLVKEIKAFVHPSESDHLEFPTPPISTKSQHKRRSSKDFSSLSLETIDKLIKVSPHPNHSENIEKSGLATNTNRRTQPLITSNRNKLNYLSASKADRVKKNTHASQKRNFKRIRSKSSEESEDVDDLELSGHSEPEQKLRKKMKKPREELISLRKAREDKIKKINKMKDLNSKRIVPDSDSESGRDESSESEEDDSEDESTCDSISSSSMNDADFIVDDMTDKRKANKIQRELECHLPAEFRSTAHDYLPHFKLVCQYLVLGIFLPHTNWLGNSEQYRTSFKRIKGIANSKRSLVNSAAWTSAFRRSLERRPFFGTRTLPSQSNPKSCDACNKKSNHSTTIVILRGKRYDSETLEILTSDSSSDDGHKNNQCPNKEPNFRSIDQPNEFKFSCGPECTNKAAEYHYCNHWHHYLRTDLCSEVKKYNKSLLQPVKKSDPKPNKEEKLKLRKHVDQLVSILEKDGRLTRLYHIMKARIEKVGKEYTTG